MVKRSIQAHAPRFSTARMVAEYTPDDERATESAERLVARRADALAGADGVPGPLRIVGPAPDGGTDRG